jgi:hypothetical protein
MSTTLATSRLEARGGDAMSDEGERRAKATKSQTRAPRVAARTCHWRLAVGRCTRRHRRGRAEARRAAKDPDYQAWSTWPAEAYIEVQLRSDEPIAVHLPR